MALTKHNFISAGYFLVCLPILYNGTYSLLVIASTLLQKFLPKIGQCAQGFWSFATQSQHIMDQDSFMNHFAGS